MPSNTQRVDWLQFKTCTEVAFRQGYVELPAFSVNNPTWTGASEIVQQYNFSADRNFRLVTLPAKPVGVNYGLCIKFRIGTVVYRYKLWNDANFVTLTAGPYTNQLIGKNFVLEIWSFNGETISSQDAIIRVVSSIRLFPTDYRNISTYAIAVGAEVTLADLELPITTVVFPTGSCLQRLVADDLAGGALLPVAVDSWGDRIQGSQWTQTDGNKMPLCYGGTAGIINGHKYVLFDGVDDFLKAVGVIISYAGPGTYYIVVQAVSWTNFDIIAVFGGNYIEQLSGTPQIVGGFSYSNGAFTQVSDPNSDLIVGSWKLIRMRLATDNTGGLVINDGVEIAVTAQSGRTIGGTFYLGADNGTGPSNIKVAELAIYRKDTVADGSDDAIKAYFYQTYGLESVVIQDTGSNVPAEQYWLDNTL